MLKLNASKYHRFLDESGDMTFFGKGKVNILNSNGVSKSFSLGLVEIKNNLDVTREEIKALCKLVEDDPYLNVIPSVSLKIKNGGFWFHAKDDPPEVRKIMFDYLRLKLNFSLDIVVARKLLSIFESKHLKQEDEFYAELLSHLLKDKLAAYEKLVINVAARGTTTKNSTLTSGLEKAKIKFNKNRPDQKIKCDVVFNTQKYTQETLLSIADYSMWAVQRVFEKGETRYYDVIKTKIPRIVDLYDTEKYPNFKNYYGPSRPLTSSNIIGPLSP